MSDLSAYGSLTLLYYEDIDAAVDFYTNKLELPQVADYGYVKFVEVCEGTLIGLLDGKVSETKPSPEKPIRYVILTDDAGVWWDKLIANGVKLRQDEPVIGEQMKCKCFSFYDPDGYIIEVLEFYTPYGVPV